ncbi:hypothetical protein Tdes44962_MAKER06887 [Teratosphaeria destructans]|uniref:Uncharacterized protein n=1 Tax=Teratosphaeria destructans TaxID=418781 RepID=A0A9W7T084_9PEZI|nr:hypothetical protein Tdes44962_MAKER06887 [Teratosphaeria destructans]
MQQEHVSAPDLPASPTYQDQMPPSPREDIRITFLRLCLTACLLFALHGLKTFATTDWMTFAFDCIQGDHAIIAAATADMKIEICKRYQHVLQGDRLVLNEVQEVTLVNTGMDQQIRSDREPAWDDLLVTALRRVEEFLPRFAGEEMVERFGELKVRRDGVEEVEQVQRQIQKLAEEMDGVETRKEG